MAMLLRFLYAQLILQAIIRGGSGIHCGNMARAGQFKYMVSLKHNKMHHCGGAIIDESHILTAAHCVYDLDMRLDLVVIANVTDHWDYWSVIRKVTKIIVHPLYKGTIPISFMQRIMKWVPAQTVIPHDVAVLRLETPLVLKDNIAKVDLPVDNVSPGCQICPLAGWGYYRFSVLFNDDRWADSKLRWTSLSVMTREECRRMGRLITKDQLCVMDMRFGSCALPGDSGSPLVCNNIIIGITSTSYMVTYLPQTFINVYRYLEFIRSAMAE